MSKVDKNLEELRQMHAVLRDLRRYQLIFVKDFRKVEQEKEKRDKEIISILKEQSGYLRDIRNLAGDKNG